MNDLATHHFENKPIRVIPGTDGEAWFVAPDVCRVLDMADVTSALRVLDEDEKGPLTVRTPGGEQLVNCISEPGLYKLMSRSRKPEAKRFDRWVRHEVLPAIRRDGGYMLVGPDETPEELALRALTVLQATVERQKAQLAIAMPKAEALDRISEAEGSLSVTAAAKALHMRPKDLFAFLQRHAWIYRRAGSGTFLGYSSKTVSGLVEHKVTTVERADGTDRVIEQVLITAKGLTRLATLIKPLGIAAQHFA